VAAAICTRHRWVLLSGNLVGSTLAETGPKVILEALATEAVA